MEILHCPGRVYLSLGLAMWSVGLLDLKFQKLLQKRPTCCNFIYPRYGCGKWTLTAIFFPVKIVILHGYVRLPESKCQLDPCFHHFHATPRISTFFRTWPAKPTTSSKHCTSPARFSPPTVKAIKSYILMMWLDHFPIQSWFGFKDFLEMLERYSLIPFKLLLFHSWPSGITKHGLLDNGLFISDFPSQKPPFSSGIRKSSTNSHTTKPNVTFLLNKNDLDRVQDKASTAEIEHLQPLFTTTQHALQDLGLRAQPLHWQWKN